MSASLRMPGGMAAGAARDPADDAFDLPDVFDLAESVFDLADADLDDADFFFDFEEVFEDAVAARDG